MDLQTYLRHRKLWEVVLTVLAIVTTCLANVAVELFDWGRDGAGFRASEPWLLQGSSHFAILLLLPMFVWFDRLVPLRLRGLRRAIAAHIMFSIVFSFLHVTIMYWIRVWLYPTLVGHRYHWDNWLAEFGYEYMKDGRTYLSFLLAIYLYRFVLLRLQGEAGIVADGDTDTAQDDTSPIADRFVVKKLGREFLVRIDEIEWIESAGNYVNLHVAGKAYPLRETMTRIAQRLAARGFLRVHRQAIVNIDRIREMRVVDSGDGELQLDTGSAVPVSRRYKAALNAALKK